ncbi:MFS transporter [Streptomyces sp. NPDC054766]|uniref:MFS transporter n=1 Tax=Streptomyces rhizosphaerihabitans TaxID=1266770 RepID=UPI0021BF95BF|nr:MFS transporter [Streptomyces rhizosphaerihabitans]MCT9008471.1 MFS transporter [Streptomyces rhizosphaerihabitans]
MNSRNLGARFRSWLPAGHSARRLIAASFVDSVGTGLFIAGSALFFTRVLGLSTVQIGLGLTLAGLAGFLGMVPVGRLADRIGGKRAIVVLYSWRGVCFVVYPFAREPGVFFVVAFLIGIAEWGGGPIVQGIVGAVEGEQTRVRTMAVIASVRNVGFSLGAVLASVALVANSATAFAGLVFADAATFFAAAVLLSRLPAAANATTGRQRAGKSVMKVHNPLFLALAGLNGVLFLHSILLTVALPLWVVTKTEAPSVVVGAVVVLNTVLVIVLQVRLSGGSSDLPSAARRQQWSGWCLAGCCLLLALSARTGPVWATVLIVAATVALTLGEIWQSVGAWRLSYALAPEDQRGYYLSVYELGTSGISAAGPALLTWSVIGTGDVGWAGLAACFVLTGLAVVVIAGRAGRILTTTIADESTPGKPAPGVAMKQSQES